MAEAYGIQPGQYKTIVAVKTLKDNPSKTELENFMNELEIMKSVGKHPNILSLLGCCCSGGGIASGGVYAIIEYARHGNLRNYLRSQRPKDYMLSMSSYNSQTANGMKMNSLLKLYSTVNKMKINNNSNKASLDDFMGFASPILKTTTDSSCFPLADDPLVLELVGFCIQIAAGMRYLHKKNVCHRDLAARNVLLDDFRVAKIADFGLARDLKQDYYYRYYVFHIIVVSSL